MIWRSFKGSAAIYGITLGDRQQKATRGANLVWLIAKLIGASKLSTRRIYHDSATNCNQQRDPASTQTYIVHQCQFIARSSHCYGARRCARHLWSHFKKCQYVLRELTMLSMGVVRCLDFFEETIRLLSSSMRPMMTSMHTGIAQISSAIVTTMQSITITSQDCKNQAR